MLSLRDPDTGARLHFAQLQLRIKTERIDTPDRFVPLASLLRASGDPTAQDAAGMRPL